MLFSKALAGWKTVFDAKLFARRLDIAKATSIDIKHIILIIDFLSFVRKIVNLSVYSRQFYH